MQALSLDSRRLDLSLRLFNSRVMCDRTASGPTYDALEMNQTRGLATKYNDEYANPGARRANARFTSAFKPVLSTRSTCSRPMPGGCSIARELTPEPRPPPNPPPSIVPDCRTGSTVPLGGDFTGIARSKDDYQNRGGAGGHNKGQKKNTSHGGMISGWTGEVQDGFSTQHRATHKDLGKTPRTLRFGDDYEYSLERARSDVPLKTTKDGYPLPTTKNLFDSPRYATLGSLSFPQQDRTSIGVPLF